MLIYARFIVVVIYFGIVYSYIFSSQNMLIYSYEKKDYHAFTMTRIENVVTFIQEKKEPFNYWQCLYYIHGRLHLCYND